MNKKILLLIGFLIIFLSTAFIQYNNTFSGNKVISEKPIVTKQIIVIDGKNNQSLVQIKKGSTALRLLNSTHKVVTKGQNENAFITTIDGRIANQQKREFWAFYVNGKQAQVGAGSYIVKNNDTIEWKIETY